MLFVVIKCDNNLAESGLKPIFTNCKQNCRVYFGKQGKSGQHRATHRLTAGYFMPWIVSPRTMMK